ncbi:MAG: prolipoprotein diacylglyceryl transferase [Lachnospiraceae bacterium]|nr:prolipoprotein diacylglyceryl transferase [Lachnospiraceae bacterium]
MHNDLLTIGKFTLHGYSVMIALGFIIAMALCLLRAKKKNMDGDVITDIGLVGVIAGFLGAKILYIIVSYKELFANPKNVIGFPQIFSGFVAYGGIIFGFLGIFIYSRIKKINAAEYLDFTIPFIAMIQGFGRIGCFLAGCCYGGPTDSFLGVTFPSPHQMAGIKVWPTQLFSAAGDFAICGILLLFSTKNKKNGNVCVLYAILYAVGRFAVEFFRADERGFIALGNFSLSTSQFISLLILPVAIGVGILINLPKESKKKDEVKEDEEKQD